jgi:hypothetical protein
LLILVPFPALLVKPGRWVMSKLKLSDHAVDRMAKPTVQTLTRLTTDAVSRNLHSNAEAFDRFIDPRGIKESEAKRVVKHGTVTQGANGRLVHSDGTTTVVTDGKSQHVITAFRKPAAGGNATSAARRAFSNAKAAIHQDLRSNLQHGKADGSDPTSRSNIKKLAVKAKKVSDKEKDKARTAKRNKRVVSLSASVSPS